MNTIDMPAPSAVRLQVKKFIRASRDRVFAAWTQPELMTRWYAPGNMTVGRAESDLRIGGRFLVQMLVRPGEQSHCGDGSGSTVSGKYLEIVVPERLSFTWQWQNDPEAPETVVTVELKESSGGTEVTLTHERLPSDESRKRHEHGWTGCLDNLAGWLQAS